MKIFFMILILIIAMFYITEGFETLDPNMCVVPKRL